MLDRELDPVTTDGLDTLDVRELLEEFLESPSIRKKGDYVACLDSLSNAACFVSD